MAFKQCKAKSKQSGVRCKSPVTPGKEVCYKHGGASTGAPKGHTNSLKHGLYSNVLTGEDKKTYEIIRANPQTLDDHIALLETKIVRFAKADQPGWSFDDWRTEVQQEFKETEGEEDQANNGIRVKKTVHTPLGADMLCKMLDTLTRMYWRRHQMLMDGQGESDNDIPKFVKSPFPMPDKPSSLSAAKELSTEAEE